MRLAPHPFTTRQLQYAVAVAEARSFSQAAVLCGVSQPSLSAQLAQLEDAFLTITGSGPRGHFRPVDDSEWAP